MKESFKRIALGTLVIALSACAERAVTPVLVRSLGPAAPVETSGLSLRVATANLWGVAVLGFDWADDIDERFAAFAERLTRNEPRLDVVLIQEAWKTTARRKMLAADGVARNFPFRVDAVDAPGGAGLVVLSRFPIEAARFHRFEAQGNCFKFWEGDCLSGKGVLAVRLRIGARSLWIANTHLIACYSGADESEKACDQRDPNGETRWSQVVEMRTMLERWVGDRPALVGGDLNLTRSSRYYPAMTGRRIPSDPPDDPRPLLSDHASRGWTENGAGVVVAKGIDYLWTRAGLNERWLARGPTRPIFAEDVSLASGQRVPLSDHPILMGTFCLSSTTSADADPECDAE